jgi:hypothetical protein
VKSLISFFKRKLRPEYAFLTGDVLRYFNGKAWVMCRVENHRISSYEYYLSLKPIEKGDLILISIFDANYYYNKKLIRL